LPQMSKWQLYLESYGTHARVVFVFILKIFFTFFEKKYKFIVLVIYFTVLLTL
jgi:hypothetical protein